MKTIYQISLLLLLLVAVSAVVEGQSPIQNKRPPPEKRTFVSTAVDAAITEIAGKMKDKDLATVFSNCLPNTLDTTVQHFSDDPTNPDAFIITGDIDAMWQRDSSSQVAAYVRFANKDNRLKMMLKGLILRQARNMLLDPYANAFLYKTGSSPWHSDNRIPKMADQLWEGKYELDSITWPIRLATDYWKTTRDATVYNHQQFFDAMQLAIKVIKYQQKPVTQMSRTDPLFYGFGRKTENSIDTLFDFVGRPGKAIGLSRSPFRPSDDSATLPYPIAANAMASASLKELSDMFFDPRCSGMPNAFALAVEAASLSKQLRDAIMEHGVLFSKPSGERYFAYEIDGFGGTYNMDDANVPSLLSLPFLGFMSSNDSLYLDTRRRILSHENPYYAAGKVGSGIGSPHTGYGKIWPIALIMQALTSNEDDEIVQLLRTLKSSAASTGFMHESFHVDNYEDYTRDWFAWANSLFGELILQLAQHKPHLIF